MGWNNDRREEATPEYTIGWWVSILSRDKGTKRKRWPLRRLLHNPHLNPHGLCGWRLG
jgi:hypothetical protein